MGETLGLSQNLGMRAENASFEKGRGLEYGGMIR